MPVVGEPTIEKPTDEQVARYGNGPRNFVRMREAPDQVDGEDPKRAAMVHNAYGKQDDVRRQYQRQIEENIRMRSGQQWSMWHPMLQRWLDVSEWMSASEQRWRLRPTFNRLLPWFMITHARATESQPILTFLPGP